MKRILSLFAIVLLCSQLFAAGKSKGLEIEGTVTKNGKRLKGATVEIFDGNQVVETVLTEKDGHFFYTMEFDKYYGIQVTMEGYVPKRMWFDTNCQDKDLKFEAFQCFVEIMPENEFAGLDISALDFPVAVVVYDHRVEQFIPKKKYSKTMRTEYNRLLTESAILREEEK